MADAHGLTVAAVYARAKKAGARRPPRPSNTKPAQRDESILRSWNEGELTTAAIAERHGVTRAAVRNAVRRMGGAPRARGRRSSNNPLNGQVHPRSVGARFSREDWQRYRKWLSDTDTSKGLGL